MIQIKQCLGTTKKEIESKKYNIWIGISLGNKSFTKDYLEDLMLWAISYTKEDVLIVIGDRLHAINIELLDGYKKLHAHKVALRKGDEKEQLIRNIITTFPSEIQQKFHIARYREMTNTKYHDYRLEILQDEYKSNKIFREYIHSIIFENKKVQQRDRTETEIKNLSQYVLLELPLYINGAKYGGLPENGGKTYLLQPYPGLGKIDELLIGLQEGILFPELSKKLKITDKIALVEAYSIPSSSTVISYL